MPGYKIRTDLPAKRTYVLARKVAHTRDFLVEDAGERAFVATKGNFLLTLFFGAYFGVYCKFQVSVEDYGKVAEVIINRNSPALTSGAIGVARVKNRSREYANSIITEILAAGGKVLDEAEF